MIDTSQNGETKIIRRYLPGVGRYLDIGANDGKTLSNTYGLYLDGWRGVNVEPSAEAYRRLCENQPECVNINAAISTERGEGIMYESGEHLGTGDVSLLSSLDPDEVKRWSKETFKQVRVTTIMAEDINAGDIDLLSLDIEGLELFVLPSLMEIYKPRMAVIEFNGKNRAQFEKIMNGYGVVFHNGENLMFYKR